MRNLIPRFIFRNYKRKVFSGRFKSTSMLIDIVGFTGLTEDLMTNGKEGAEILSEVINRVFEPAIDIVYSNGGWITGFAGDAFSVVFPGVDNLYSIIAAKEIQKMFSGLTIRNKFANLELSARIGLSYGSIKWEIISNNFGVNYYFRGSALEQAALSKNNCKPNTIIIDKDLKERLGKEINCTLVKKDYFSLNTTEITLPKLVRKKEKLITNSLLSKFIPKHIISLKSRGEFRDVVPVFISFENTKIPGKLINILSEKLEQFGGYLDKIDFGEKGFILLVLFGAPLGIENPVIHAVEFTLALKTAVKNLTRVKFGLSFGTVYAGIIGSRQRSEYSVLGRTVNLASRVLSQGNWGCIYFCDSILKELEGRFNFELAHIKKLKGITRAKKIYHLLDRKLQIEPFFKGSLIGRKKELQKLKTFLKPLKKSQFGGIIYIDGTTGIGKSRLIDELRKRLNIKEFTWFYLQCDEVLRESFNPIKSFLKNYFKQKPQSSEKIKKETFTKLYKKIIKDTRDKEIRKELIRTESIIGALINLYWSGSLFEVLNPKERYLNTLYAIKNLFKAVSLNKPLIIEIDDANWIDNETEELLKILGRNVKNYPFIIIAACRLNDDGSEFRFPISFNIQNSILLQYFDKKLSAEFIKEKLKGDISKELFDLIWDKTAGNPFFIEQLILYLQESSLIKIQSGKSYLISKDINIPNKISSIIIARVDRLESKLKDLIKKASVIGMKFSVNILNELMKSRSIMGYLKEIENEAIWTSISEIKYIFKHALIRETIYEMQLKKTLRNLHQLTGEIIEKIYKNELEQYYHELSYHFEKADNKSKAKEYIEKAGNYAYDNFQNQDAVLFFMKLLKFQIAPTEKILIRMKLASIFYNIGEWEKSAEIYRQSLRQSIHLKDNELIAEVKKQFGGLLQSMGEHKKSLKLLKDSLSIFSNLNLRKDIAICFGHIGVVYGDQGKFPEAVKYFKKQLEIGEEIGDQEVINTAINNLGLVCYYLGQIKDANDYLIRGLNIARKNKDKRAICKILGNLGLLYWRTGELRMAMDSYQEEFDLAEELGLKQSIAMAWGNMGVIHYTRGKFKKALEYFNKYLQMSYEIGDKHGISKALGNIAVIHYEKGEYPKAVDNFNAVLKIMKELDNKMGIVLSLENLGSSYRKIKKRKNAMKCFDDALKVAEKFNLKFFLPSLLLNKAELSFLNKEFENASKINLKVQHLSEEVKRPDVLLSSNLLKAKLLGVKNKVGAGKFLKSLLEKFNEDDSRAFIYYEIYKLLKDDKSRKKSLSLFRKIHKESPDIDYKIKIDELQKN
ncbi:tetratricopeptide repeat protein [Candidatus Dependentiae bacterium]|nr:tetratricopeptide repeat protein [Candidatus Dependentiae bacterium]